MTKNNSVTADPLAMQAADNPLVFPSKGIIAGETVAQWTEAWWEWALNTPSATSPLTDTTGAFANVDQSGPQSGPVFFVAGLAGDLASKGIPVTREFNVPANTPLLIPLQNLIDVLDTPGHTNQVLANKNFTFEPGGFQTSVSDLFLTIDGQPIGNLQSGLVRTDFFTLGPIQQNSTGTGEGFGFPPDTVFAGSKSDGFWALIKPFAPGSTHTISFGGNSTWNGGSSIHVTDIIHVLSPV
jgi:hypothetical protein